MSKRVVVVEDSLIQAALLQEHFEALGYEVVVVHTGNEVVPAVDHFNPDVIILDYLLPDLNGIEVCKKLKCDLQMRLTPILMYSAEDNLQNMVRAYEAGADYYVVKNEESNKVLQLLIETIFKRKGRNLGATRPSIEKTIAS
ncbi:MAG: response regulator [Chloroflexota bacterium]|nr:response regulator [Chloroflexota bacterium]